MRLVLMDVDGVLTDGRILLLSDGGDGRFFSSVDGHGIRMGMRAGLAFGIVSGRSSHAVARRAEELGIGEVHQGIADKQATVREILGRHGLEPAQLCFVGDDLVDLPAMRRAGLAVAPSDAVPEVREAAHLVTAAPGGRGAVRETIDLLLRASGAWARVTAPYLEG